MLYMYAVFNYILIHYYCIFDFFIYVKILGSCLEDKILKEKRPMRWQHMRRTAVKAEKITDYPLGFEINKKYW